MKKDDTTGTIFYSVGFALGDSESVPVPALHNHYNLYLECVAGYLQPLGGRVI